MLYLSYPRTVSVLILFFSLVLLQSCEKNNSLLDAQQFELAPTNDLGNNPVGVRPLRPNTSYSRQQVLDHLKKRGFSVGENYDLTRADETSPLRIGDLVLITADPRPGSVYSRGAVRAAVVVDLDSDLYYDLRTGSTYSSITYGANSWSSNTYRFHQKTIGLPLMIGELPDGKGKMIGLELATYVNRYGNPVKINYSKVKDYSVGTSGIKVDEYSYKWDDLPIKEVLTMTLRLNGRSEGTSVHGIYYATPGLAFGFNSRDDYYPDELFWHVWLRY